MTADEPETRAAEREALAALERIAQGCVQPGHVAYLTKTAMAEIARRALAAQPDPRPAGEVRSGDGGGLRTSLAEVMEWIGRWGPPMVQFEGWADVDRRARVALARTSGNRLLRGLGEAVAHASGEDIGAVEYRVAVSDALTADSAQVARETSVYIRMQKVDQLLHDIMEYGGAVAAIAGQAHHEIHEACFEYVTRFGSDCQTDVSPHASYGVVNRRPGAPAAEETSPHPSALAAQTEQPGAGQAAPAEALTAEKLAVFVAPWTSSDFNAREAGRKLATLFTASVHGEGGWRPISEAPRDGTLILIWRDTRWSDDTFTVVRWEDGDTGEWWQVHDGKSDHPLRGPDPLWWRACPAPPSTDTPAQGGEEK